MAWAEWVAWVLTSCHPVVAKEMSLLLALNGKSDLNCGLFFFSMPGACACIASCHDGRCITRSPAPHDLFPWQPSYFGPPYQHPFAQQQEASQQHDQVYDEPHLHGETSGQESSSSSTDSNSGSGEGEAAPTENEANSGNDDSESTGNPDWDRIREVG